VAEENTQPGSGQDPADSTLLADGTRERTGIASNVFYLGLGQVGTMMLGILLSSALARMLGARDFGVYFLVSSTAAFAFTIVEWGQPLLLIREVARIPNRAGELLGTGLTLRALMSASVSGPLLLIAFFLGYGTSNVLILAVYFVAMLPTSLAQGFTAVFRGFNRMDRDALVSMLNSAVELVLVLSALAFGGGLAAVGLCQLAAGLVSLLIAADLYRRLQAPRIASTRGMAHRLWWGGAAIMSLTVVQAVQPFLDVVILSKLVPSEAVGWFGAARSIMGTLLAPAVILGTATFPQLSRVGGEPDRLGPVVRIALRPMMLVGALGSAGTYLFAQIAVETIYGTSHYAPAVSILLLFSPVMFLLFVDMLLGRALLAANRARAVVALKVASVILSTALNMVLIPWFQTSYGNGGMGIIIGFAFGELIMFAGVVAILPHDILRRETLIEAAKSIAAAGVTVLLLGRIPGLPPAAGGPLALFVFIAIASALGLIRRRDLALLGEVAQILISRRA
jgi:O-antigen/teichoic acid export membrane protein